MLYVFQYAFRSELGSMSYILQMLMPVLFFLCLGCGTVLLLRSRDELPRRLLGATLLVWTLPYLRRIVFILKGSPTPQFSPPVDPWLAMVGLFLTLILLVYPVVLVHPGRHTWLNIGRIGVATCALPVIYLVGVIVSDESRVFASVFMIAVAVAGLAACAAAMLSVRSAAVYIRLRSGVTGCLCWVYIYCIGVLLISLCFIVEMITYSRVPMLLHSLAVMLFVVYATYNSLVNEPKGMCTVYAVGDASSDPFLAKLPEYVDAVSRWLVCEKPYLDKNFKLTDTTKVVPLNRSYLSRLYNDGFGKTFTDLVRDLRIEEARRLLVESPGLSIGDVAERCGFASHSSFHRSFTLANDGKTPGEYRSEHIN